MVVDGSPLPLMYLPQITHVAIFYVARVIGARCSRSLPGYLHYRFPSGADYHAFFAEGRIALLPFLYL